MVHNQLHAIDLIIIAAYLISMVLIGVVVVKKVQSMGRLLSGRPVLRSTGADGYRVRHHHRRQRPYGPGGRGLFQRL